MPKMFSRRNALLKRWPSLGRGARVGAKAPLFTQCPLDHLNLTAPEHIMPARAAGRLCQPQKTQGLKSGQTLKGQLEKIQPLASETVHRVQDRNAPKSQRAKGMTTLLNIITTPAKDTEETK